MRKFTCATFAAAICTALAASAENFRLLAENKINEITLATPVANNGRVLIRTFEHLYCIAK